MTRSVNGYHLSSFNLILIFILIIINAISVDGCAKTVHVPQESHKTEPKLDENIEIKNNEKEDENIEIDHNKCLCSDCKFDIQQVIIDLSKFFSQDLYGQHIAVSTIPTLIQSHLEQEQPRKSLVLSLHGSSGVGKTYTAMSIMKIFNTKYNNVQYFHGATLSRRNIDEQIELVTKTIQKTTSSCNRAMFIFDENDLLDNRLIDALFPYMEYQENVDGIDYRKTTFIFIGREAGTVINDIVIGHMKKDDGLRENLQLIQFEKSITNSVFNGQGGFHRSIVLQNGLIDIFVPFLPLERKHIVQCIQHYLESTNRQIVAENTDLVEQVADSIQYFKHSYASTGCKKVSARTDLTLKNQEIQKEL